VLMRFRCASGTAGIGKDRQQSEPAHPNEAGSDVSARNVEGS
jgi:hypothetical protein